MVSINPEIASSVVTDQVIPSRPSSGSFLPDAEANVRQVRSMNEGEIQCPVDKMSESLRLKPFRDTRFGRLATEIRQMIFTNLLASPPAYGGHDFRAAPESSSSQSPISLATFVDLKRSCLAILQTCRQVYLEAFPVFYANKSYYITNAQDLLMMLRRRAYLRVEPRLFRLDTITSLCLRNFVFDKPRWSSENIDFLTSGHDGLNREILQAERTVELDSGLLFVNFQEMKSLRKICLCMLAGQEREYLKFLFNIKGFGRGVIDFMDDFHWSIRSQNVSADDWKLQYAAFSYHFYRMGKNFELLSGDDVVIQQDALDISSRASDLTEGDERWVEIDIGARMYEETKQHHEEIMRHHRTYRDMPDSVPSQGSESEETPVEEAIDLLPDDAPDRTTSHLQELVNCQGDNLQSQDEWEERSQHLQVQRNGQNDDTKVDNEPAQGSSYLNLPADGQEQNDQAEFCINAMSDASKGSSTEDSKEASVQIPQKKEFIDLSTLFNIQLVNTPIKRWPECSVILPNDGGTQLQANVDQSKNPAMVTQGGNTTDLQTQPRKSTQACTKRSLKSQKISYGDAHTRKDLVQSKKGHAEGAVKAKKVQKKLIKPPTAPETPAIPLTPVAARNSSLNPEKERLSLSVAYPKLYLRAATLILALSLAYIIQSEQFEKTVSQLLILFHTILLWFAIAAVFSEESG